MFFSRYRIYTVHINPSLPQPYESAQFVEEGFSIPAFLLSGFWALYNRLWWPMFAIIVFNLIFKQMLDDGTINQMSHAVIEFGFNLFIGFQANDWKRNKLARKGYILADIITGDSLIRAQQRFYDRHFAQSPAAA